MRVLISRHGNTFGSDQQGGEKAFISGSKNNIPLVEFGRSQARNFAKYLAANKIVPAALYANHLIRTWEYAVIVKEYFLNKHNKNIPLYKDERLLEMDYGAWAGLTEQEARSKFGDDAWFGWQTKRIIYNESPHNWQITKEQIINNIQSLFADLCKNHAENDVPVLIGSQGSIAFVNLLLPGGMDEAIKEQRVTTKTGNFAELSYENGVWSLVTWNKKPL